MAMKLYFTFPTSPELEPHHQTQFSVIPRTNIYIYYMVQSVTLGFMHFAIVGKSEYLPPRKENAND